MTTKHALRPLPVVILSVERARQAIGAEAESMTDEQVRELTWLAAQTVRSLFGLSPDLATGLAEAGEPGGEMGAISDVAPSSMTSTRRRRARATTRVAERSR